MTSTCLPPAAYYQINRNQSSVKPRIQEPQNLEVQNMLDNMNIRVARPQEWEAAFVLVFGQKAFEEDYPCIDWSAPCREWSGDAERFSRAFTLADEFVASVMHRLFPFQYREMIPALTHALMAWSLRREACLPIRLLEDDAKKFLTRFGYDNMADWLEQQQ